MLRYFLSTQYREAHRFLTQNKFIGFTSQLYQMKDQDMRNNIKQQIKQKKILSFRKYFQVLNDFSKSPREMIKALIFIHAIIQQAEIKNKNSVQNEIKEQINKILKKLKTFKLNQYKKSVSKVVITQCSQPQNHFRGLQKKRSRSQCSKESSMKQSSVTQSFREQLKINSINADISDKQMICSSLIQPYCMYLLRKCLFEMQSTEQMQNNQIQVIIWHNINNLKALFKLRKAILLCLDTTIKTNAQIKLASHQPLRESTEKRSQQKNIILDEFREQINKQIVYNLQTQQIQYEQKCK